MGKFIAITAYNRKMEWYQVKNILLHLKDLEKQEHTEHPKLRKERKNKYQGERRTKTNSMKPQENKYLGLI